MKSLIQDEIKSYRDEILDFTKALVAIPTENPPGRAYSQCVELIAQELRELGVSSKVVKITSGEFPRYGILGFYGQAKRTLYFHGHYDVVPAANQQQFRPFVRGDRLFGRGSSDMKSGLAAMIYAIKALKECHIDLNGRIGLTIVPDEETGGVLGSQYLAHKDLLGKNGIGMLTPEPTGGTIWNASRGAISIRLTVKGKPAHVGLHYQGVNAFEKMLSVANVLLKLKKKVEKRKTRFNIYPDAARRSVLLVGGRCEGGTNFNLVPGECSFTVDRRINPEEELRSERQKFAALFDRLRARGINLKHEILQEGRSARISEREPLAQTLRESVLAITGRAPRFEMCPGLLEIRFYIERGIPALAYGPGLLKVSHGPNEFVRISDVVRCATVYALTATRMLG